MKQYKDMIFDMGNVLLDFSPFSIVSNFTSDTSLINLLVKEIFYQQEWLDLDQGIMDEDTAYLQITKRLDSNYHTLVKQILDHWHEYLVERDEMSELLSMLKQKGYKLYLFSNASLRFNDYKNRMQVLTYFDQKIISAEIKLSKPSEAFYIKALELCGIEANDSFFIDDSPINILNANQYGIDGYIYNGSYTLLKDYLQKLNIL